MSRRKARPLDGFEQSELQRDPTSRPLQSLRLECLVDDTEYALKWPRSALTRQLTGLLPVIPMPPVLTMTSSPSLDVKMEASPSYLQDEKPSFDADGLALLFGFELLSSPSEWTAAGEGLRSIFENAVRWFAERRRTSAPTSPSYEPKCVVELPISFRRDVLTKLNIMPANASVKRVHQSTVVSLRRALGETLWATALENAEEFWHNGTAVVEFFEDTAAGTPTIVKEREFVRATGSGATFSMSTLQAAVPFRPVPHTAVVLQPVEQRAVYDAWIGTRSRTATIARPRGMPLAMEHFQVNVLFDEYFLPGGTLALPEDGAASAAASLSNPSGIPRALGNSFSFCGDFGLSAASTTRRRGGASSALQWFLTDALPVELPWSKSIARALGTRSRLKSWVQEQLLDGAQQPQQPHVVGDAGGGDVVHTLRIKGKKRERDEFDGGASTWVIDDVKSEVDECRKWFGK